MPHHGLPDLALIRPGRMHEVTGPGRRVFAAALARLIEGPVLWVQESRNRDTLCPQGLLPYFEPARLVIVRSTGAQVLLQVVEEALRSGAAPLVVAELGDVADLTASRRFQLAAETGGGRGLCLVPGTRVRPNAAETRWHCTPMPGLIPGSGRQRWELVKNKRGNLGTWEVTWQKRVAAPRQHEHARLAAACA